MLWVERPPFKPDNASTARLDGFQMEWFMLRRRTPTLSSLFIPAAGGCAGTPVTFCCVWNIARLAKWPTIGTAFTVNNGTRQLLDALRWISTQRSVLLPH